MTRKFTVVTVLNPGKEYSWDHVERLKAQVLHHSPRAKFVTMNRDPASEFPLVHEWPTWWPKIELFRPNQFKGHVVYLDLDSTVVGPLERLIRDEFTMLSDFNWPQYPASGVMAWKGDAPSKVYDTFIRAPHEFINTFTKFPNIGDQGFIRAVLGDEVARFGPEVVSYKKHVLPVGSIPKEAVLVAFHGRPRPWMVKELHK